MYRTMKKIHLWVGLLLAVFLLAEAVTGLILAEPGIIGQAKHMPQGDSLRQSFEQGRVSGDRSSGPPAVREGQSGFNALQFVKGLHQGRIGSWELTWLLDLAAIGLIVLTVTGAYMSIKVLKAGGRNAG